MIRDDIETVEEFLEEADRVLYSMAIALADGRASHPRFDDSIQEGRIAAWTAWERLGDTEPQRIRFALATGRQRIREMLWKEGVKTTTSIEYDGRRYEPLNTLQRVPLVQVNEDGDPDENPELPHETLGEVEMAYHHGEIAQALEALTPKQRQYVFARFWCGIDSPAGSRSEVIKAMKDQNPFLRRDVLWTGNKTTRGAKERLREALGHLAA